MDKHVFVSYVRQDSDLVDRLCATIEKSGVQVWRDRDKLEPGEFWQDSIRRAISEGAYFVACFSDAYFRRHRTYMNTEIGLAIEELAARPRDSKWFIPVLLSDCSIPAIPIVGLGTLRDIHAVSLHHDWSRGIDRLLRVLLPDRRDGAAQAQVKASTRGASTKHAKIRRKPRLKDLKESGDYDPGYKLLAPEERILLSMASSPAGVTMATACRSFALRPERLHACLDRLAKEELLSVEEVGGEATWRLSEIGRRFLRDNYWAHLV
jgi:hypothetical protein